MTNDAMAESDLQFRRRCRRTRWIALLLEGATAAAFIGILFQSGRWAGFAFAAVALVAFLLWPMTVKNRDFPLWRLAIFGALVFCLGGCLWLFVFELSLWKSTDRSILFVLAQTLEWTILGVLVLGIVAIPAAIGIAWLSVILGNPRIDPK